MEDKEENKIWFPKKPFKVFILVLGIPLTLFGLSGIIIDSFFQSYSNSFHAWAGESNWQRFLLGSWFLFAYFMVRRSERN